MTTAPAIRRRFNKDGTIVVLCKGRVAFKSRDLDAIASFIRGWHGVAA